ncbi:MAG: 3-keto-5-aminohexanoate cleavage protein [Rubrivivax sp.]
MQFLDDSLLPENQQPLVIQVAPYGPEFLPGDSDDIPVTMAEQVQKAVDCWNAGATVLHVHVREADGKGSKRLSMFNEMLARLREAVPGMLLQVGGSISFAPEGEGAAAQWLGDDTRHMLAELDPKPDQVTIAINTNQMNVCELLSADDVAGTSLALAPYQQAYREMWIPSGPAFVEEHLRRLQARGIQPHFMLGDAGQLESVERLVRRGVYTGPLVLNWVAIGGGADGPNPYNLMEFVRRVPPGALLTVEGLMRNVLPLGTMAIAMGLHVRVGIEDNLWGRKGERITSVQQVEQMVRIARELHRDVAGGEEARRLYRIGEHYGSADETLAALGWAPNRREGERGMPLRRVA